MKVTVSKINFIKPFEKINIRVVIDYRRLSIFEQIMKEVLIAKLKKFHGISLEELARAPLMNRTDEKFAFHRNELPEILDLIAPYYDVLTIDGKYIFDYSSQYFDNERFQFFNDHHRSIPKRFKVRIRTYIDSNASFLEVKEKMKGRTDKKRITTNGFKNEFDAHEMEFLEKRLGGKMKLKPVMINSYRRITLVNKTSEERLTIDFDVTNGSLDDPTNSNQTLNEIIIAELKQPKLDRTSPFYQLMKNRLIRPFRISKFCFGMMDIYTQFELKSNRFKSKRIFIKKINNR
ncbi:MAG: polyphosphate polymerase domain-containing protein [Fluviicola sp.]|nr:polyphosphate polymerase domain-containing protein [Fluviicola sp.]MBP6271632.1 polyphosphate polymerase domain-containing protein [Fluviicola sp.]